MNPNTLLSEIEALPDCRLLPVAETAAFLPADWPVPIGIVEPFETVVIAEIVKSAERHGVALIPMGGGTKRFTGNPPKRDKPYLLVRMTACSKILAYEPDDLTVTVEPGITLAALQTALSAKNQNLALAIPQPEQATLGGIVATNGAGFERGAWGAARDLLLGVTAIMTGGIEVHGGGRVVKNVAGYDICKLFTGSWGTVGILTEMTFKVRANVPARQVLAFAMPDCATAVKTGLALHHAQLAPLLLVGTSEFRNSPHLLVGMEGPQERVAWQAEEFARRITAAGISANPVLVPETELNALRDRQARNDGETDCAARLSCLLTDLPTTAAKLETPGLALTADCVTGILSCATPERMSGVAGQIVQAAPNESAVVWTRANAEVAERWGTPRSEFALHRALKQAIDPQNTFSPGRFLGSL